MKYVHEPELALVVLVLVLMLICWLRLSVLMTSEARVSPDSCSTSVYLRDDAQELELEVNFWIYTLGGSSNSGGKPISIEEFMAEVGTLKK